MELTVGDRPIRPLTADQAMEMVRAGIVAQDERVELLHGVLTAMSPQDPPHASVVRRLTRWLAPVLSGDSYDVSVQLPFRVPDDRSLPEPDVAVIARHDSMLDHPHMALLVIEVACSSLNVDTKVKPELYAAAGVPEYWIVDVKGRRLERLRELSGPTYTLLSTHEPPESVRPTQFAAPALELAELFEGL